MTDNDELIIACTLDPDLVRERVDEWKALLSRSADVEPHDTGVRLRFDRRRRDDDVTMTGIAALAAAEHECCPFFSFVISLDDEGIFLDITAPPAARALVDVLLGLPGPT